MANLSFLDHAKNRTYNAWLLFLTEFRTRPQVTAL